MRWLLCAVLIMPSVLWAASPSANIESLASQLSPFWHSHRQTCVMALQPDVQTGVVARLNFLDERLIASQLTKSLTSYANDRSAQWRSTSWAQRDKLEKNALRVQNRESLREYYFKLQTQTPERKRAKIIADIQYMSEQLNVTLRKELWKTCHGLGLDGIPVTQLETAVEKRWQAQASKIKLQLKSELAAFYFYSFRNLDDAQLQTFADVAKALQPWVDATSRGVSEHFAQLRTQLLAVPVVLSSESVDVPSLGGRPWPPSPSLGLPQP